MKNKKAETDAAETGTTILEQADIIVSSLTTDPAAYGPLYAVVATLLALFVVPVRLIAGAVASAATLLRKER